MPQSITWEISDPDLRFLLNALETFEAELEQLEASEDWFSSDSRDLLASAYLIIRQTIGTHTEEYDDEYDEEIQQVHYELRF